MSYFHLHSIEKDIIDDLSHNTGLDLINLTQKGIYVVIKGLARLELETEVKI